MHRHRIGLIFLDRTNKLTNDQLLMKVTNNIRTSQKLQIECIRNIKKIPFWQTAKAIKMALECGEIA